MSITLLPPLDGAPFKQFKLHSGTTYRPDFSKGGRVTVDTEEDAQDLEREGWRRDAASKRAAAINSDLLQKGLAAQMRHLGVAKATSIGRDFGVVDLGDGRRVRVAHIGDELNIAGVKSVTTDLAPNLRQHLDNVGARFDEAQDADAVASARFEVALVVAEVLRRDPYLDAKVRERV